MPPFFFYLFSSERPPAPLLFFFSPSLQVHDASLPNEEGGLPYRKTAGTCSPFVFFFSLLVDDRDVPFLLFPCFLEILFQE